MRLIRFQQKAAGFSNLYPIKKMLYSAIILLLLSCNRRTSFCTSLSKIMSVGWIVWENKHNFQYYLLYFALSWPADRLSVGLKQPPCKPEQVINSDAALEKIIIMYWNRLKKIFLPAGAAGCINAYFIFNGAVWTFFDIILYLFISPTLFMWDCSSPAVTAPD